MFPNAGPGVGLVLLRIAVAATLVAAPNTGWITWPLAVLLGLGLATPILAVVASFLHAAQIVTDPAHAKPAVALLIAVALALLGPGAYSFDARRFGRRLVVMSEHDPD